jgi:bifunctional non-homologous end joining protein LigD
MPIREPAERPEDAWYEGITAEDMLKISWLKPKIVAEFAFTEWTAQGLVRHPRFIDLRPAVEPRSVRRVSQRSV